MTKHFDFNNALSASATGLAEAADIDRLRSLRRTLVAASSTQSVTDHKRFARDAAFAMASAWWTAVCKRQGADRPFRPPFVKVEHDRLLFQSSETVADFAHLAARINPIYAAYEIGMAYATLLPSEARRDGGVHYTPPMMARQLVLHAKNAGADFVSGRILEPCAGGGTLLLAALESILDAGKHPPSRSWLQALPHRLLAVELDPTAAWLAQIAVDVALLPTAIAHASPLPCVVSIGDSLEKSFENDFDVVIMNPPFSRLKLTPDLRRKFARSLYGHANAYGLFLDQALRATKKNGVITALTPTSFLAGEYFKNLRGTLRTESNLREIGIFGARSGVFEGVQQELALTTIQKSKSSRSTHVAQLNICDSETVSGKPCGEFDLPQDLTAPWILPRTRDQVPIAQDAAKATHRLGDWGYKVKTGPVVWNRFKSKISENRQTGSFPLIWSGSVRKGGEFSWPPTARKDKAWLSIGQDQDHLLQSKPCILLQRTTSREQARRLVVAPLPVSLLENFGAVAIENHIQILEPVSEASEVSLRALEAFLNSKTADDLFRCLSGSTSVSAYELNALPLPCPTRLTNLENLVARRASADEIGLEVQSLYRRILGSE